MLEPIRFAFMSIIMLVMVLLSPNMHAAPTTEAGKQAIKLAKLAPEMNPTVLLLALKAHQTASEKGMVKKNLLTVIDYSKKSTEKRLWVFDLNRNKLLFETHVTHGEGSGGTYSTKFSNKNGSHQSSIGVFTTAETYYGGNGYSLRIDGHDKGFNDNARRRYIVFHGADYASPQYIRYSGKLGRSWGCPAVDSRIAKKLIDTIKGGSLVFSYYPEKQWLKNSPFLS